MLTHALAKSMASAVTSGMQKVRLYLLLRATVGVLWLAVAAAETSSADTAAPSPAPAKCREALVNPVSGFAECVKPRGAPVAPPKRPDAARHQGSLKPGDQPM
jgi:hypothetical protein